METKLLRQIHALQICVLVLFLATASLCINCFHPLLPLQKFKVIDAERINIREKAERLRRRCRTRRDSLRGSARSKEM